MDENIVIIEPNPNSRTAMRQRWRPPPDRLNRWHEEHWRTGNQLTNYRLQAWVQRLSARRTENSYPAATLPYLSFQNVAETIK